MIDFEKLKDYGQTSKTAPFEDIVSVLGGMTHVSPVNAAEAERYRGRLPDGLLDFWKRHGRGALLEGYGWICDPEMFRPLLHEVFDGDPQYSAEDFDIYMYSYDGEMSGWSSKFHNITMRLHQFSSTVLVHGNEPMLDVHGQLMSADFFVANSIRLLGYALMRDRAMDWDKFSLASKANGLLQPGEIFAYVPSMRIGGSGEADTMKRAKALEHMMFLAQLGPAMLQRYIYDAADPSAPMGRYEDVRLLGPQEQ